MMGRHDLQHTMRIGFVRVLVVQICLLLLTSAIVLPANEFQTSGMDIDTRELADTIESHWTPITSGLPSTGEHFSVAFGDVNNDGNLDIAASSGPVRVYVSDGAGNFVQQSTGLPGSGAYDVALADFNNDGNLDLAGNGRVYLGNGGAGGSMSWTFDSFIGPWYAIIAADLNLDGKLDLVTGADNGVHVYQGDGGVGGSIVWTDSSNGLPLSGTFWQSAVGDINHDGKPDIVCADRISGVKAWTGNGLSGPSATWNDAFTGTGLPETQSYATVDLGDVDHDGNLDIVSTAYYSQNGVRIWRGNGGSGGSMIWTEASNGLDTTTLGYLSAKLRDTNNDGNLDILAAHYLGGGLRLWLGDGGAGGTVDWTEASTGLPIGAYLDVDAGDYNNDGKMDFAASKNPGVEIWQNDRPDFVIDSYVSASINLPNSNTWADVQFEDVDHDGKLDIGFTSFQGQNQGIRVYLGDGTGVWTAASTGLPTTGDFNGLRFADIDKSGTMDIIAPQNGGGGTNGIHAWSGDGTGSWTEMPLVSSNGGVGLELADLNHDGNLDIVTGYFENNWGPTIYLGNGDYTWSADMGPAGETIEVDDVAIADVNHDGHLDFAASSMDNVGIQLWTGDGTGMPGGWTRNDTGLPASAVYLGLDFDDVNHDGHPDLVGTGFAGPTGMGMHVWLGNGGVGGTMLWTPADTGLPATGQFAGVEFGDTNLDGNPDMVFANSQNTGATGIGYMRGNGGSGGPVIWSNPGVAGIPTTGRHWGVAFGDMDNDGITDIAATSTMGVRVYKQGSPPVFSPQVIVSHPDGLQNWTGNRQHTIWWNLTDDSLNTDLIVYLNYSYNGGISTGTIVGPTAGTSNPNSFLWTTPPIDASDVFVNATVIDPDGLVGSDEVLVTDIDTSPPAVELSAPADTDTDVSINQPLIIRFSESMQRSSVISAINMIPDPGGWIWSWSSTNYLDDTITGTHNPFNYGQVYQTNVSQSALDASSPGNGLSDIFTFSFTTEAPNSSPSITIDSPFGGESWTGGTNHAISFTATDLEDPASSLLVWLNYSTTGGPPWQPVAGPLTGDLSPYIWMTPDVDTVNAYINADVTDTEGGTGADVSSSFEIDSSHPIVSVTSPTDGYPNVPTNADVQAVWSELMDIPATDLSFSLKDNATWTDVVGSMSWAGTLCRFDPATDLATGSWFTANFTTLARDDSNPGNNLETLYSWSFRTALAPDTQSPRIENVSVVPSPMEVFSDVNISADIFDDFGVFGAWINITPPFDPPVNTSLDLLGVRHFNLSTWNVTGPHDYVISAVDSAGNWNAVSGFFEVVDSTPPTISDVRSIPDSTEVNGFVNLSAIVTDNYDLLGVWVLVTDPSDQATNTSMDENTRFFLNRSYWLPGDYDFIIWAGDTGNNWAFSTGSFEILDLPQTAAYITIDNPLPGDGIRAGETIIVQGWLTEVSTNRGIPDVELMLRLQASYGQVGEESYTITRAAGRITVAFEIPEEVGGCGEYTLVIYANDTNIASANVVLSGTGCGETLIPIWIYILIIIVIAVILVIGLILIIIAKRRKRKELEPVVLVGQPEMEEHEIDESDDVQT